MLTQSRDDCKKICGYNQGRSYSDLFRVSIDPRVKPEGDGREKEPEGDEVRKCPRMTGERKCPMMTMLMGILISSMSMTGTVRAECVPYPDCASIGYTETSCETQAVKCPFDGTKLYCLPCDSKYQHSCNGVGETGEGAGCKGMYEACGCKSGYNYFCGINFCKLNYC